MYECKLCKHGRWLSSVKQYIDWIIVCLGVSSYLATHHPYHRKYTPAVVDDNLPLLVFPRLIISG